jgi:hypothetical protein
VTARGIIIVAAVVVSTTGACRQAPRSRAEIKKESTYIRNATAPPGPEASSAGGMQAATKEPDICAGLDAYPLPRTYEQILADAPKGAQRPTGLLEARMIVNSDGKVTHLRFMRLSSVDSVNKRAFDFVTKQHYKPVVVEGQQISVCMRMSINIDFQ